jgi:hypothetical protein
MSLKSELARLKKQLASLPPPTDEAPSGPWVWNTNPDRSDHDRQRQSAWWRSRRAEYLDRRIDEIEQLIEAKRASATPDPTKE